MVTDEWAVQSRGDQPDGRLYPSLHLNLGECYHKLGQLDHAREQLQRGRRPVLAG